MIAKKYRSATLLGCLLLLVGCGDDRRQTLEGTVTLDGQPLGAGAITFLPQAGTLGPTAGGNITAGRFSIAANQGTFVGDFRVEITARRKAERKGGDGGLGEQKPYYEQYLPARYNRDSQLSAEVKEGVNQFEFRLTSQ
jgi:hypothetical protein